MISASPRFDLDHTEGTLCVRVSPQRDRSHRWSLASLVAFTLFPLALLLLEVETTSLWPWVGFVVLGTVSAAFGLWDIFRRRVHREPPYRGVQHTVVIEAPTDSRGLRDLPPAPGVLIDGQRIRVEDPPRVALTRCGVRHQVSLVFEAEVVRVLTDCDRGSAKVLAEELSSALGLADPKGEIPVEELGASFVSVTLLSLVAVSGVAGAACWGIFADLPTHVGSSVMVAVAAAWVAFVVARRFGLRVIRDVASRAAQQAHGISAREPTPSAPGGRWFAVLVVAALGAVSIAGALVAAPELPKSNGYCWYGAPPKLCAIDVNADNIPDAITYTCGGSGPWSSVDLHASDVRTGAHIMGLPPLDFSNLTSCAPPFLTRDGQDIVGTSKGKVTFLAAYDTLFASRRSLWRVPIPGEIVEVLRSKGCALVRSWHDPREDTWTTVDLATGGRCSAIPEPVEDAAIEAARAEIERARPPPGWRTADGVSYQLATSESARGFALSATRGETRLWATNLPARPLANGPIAVAGGTVVVAATDLRTGRYLRLLGVDAESGRVLYLRRHPTRFKAPIALLAVGPMVLVETERLAGLVPSSGEIAWITKE